MTMQGTTAYLAYPDTSNTIRLLVKESTDWAENSFGAPPVSATHVDIAAGGGSIFVAVRNYGDGRIRVFEHR